MSNVALYELLTGVSETVGRFLGRRADTAGVKYQGAFGKPAFFAQLRKGQAAAVNTMKGKGYGHAWELLPPFRNHIEREIVRNNERTLLRKFVPRGALTGSPMRGFDRAVSNFTGSALKMNLGMGAAVGLFSIASAPKGKLVHAVSTNVGMTIGGMAGAAIGGGLLGLPGEILGAFVGGTVGEKVGAIVEPLEKFGRQARHSDFGGNYKDTEIAYTMRQRAVQEMGSSALNARRLLPPEEVAQQD